MFTRTSDGSPIPQVSLCRLACSLWCAVSDLRAPEFVFQPGCCSCSVCKGVSCLIWDGSPVSQVCLPWLGVSTFPRVSTLTWGISLFPQGCLNLLRLSTPHWDVSPLIQVCFLKRYLCNSNAVLYSNLVCVPIALDFLI